MIIVLHHQKKLDMNEIKFLTTEDVKIALREVLAEQTPPHPSEQDGFLYGLNELAKFAHVGTTTAWRIAKTLPSYKTGRKIFFRKSDVLEALKK